MGFEVVVRPAVFPNIRPNPPRVLAPPDDPTQGMAIFVGGGTVTVGVSLTWSVNVNQDRPHTETKRQFNKERIYQMAGGGSGVARDGSGTINKNNYVDVERMKRVRLDTSEGPIKMVFADPPEVENIEVIDVDITRAADGTDTQ